jgi:aminopeptidase N
MKRNKIFTVLVLSVLFNGALAHRDSLKTEPSLKTYRGSNKRINDILHTRLHVKFNWEKSQMNGEAEIIMKPYFSSTSMVYLDGRGMDIHSVEAFECDKNDLPGKKLNASYKYAHDSIKIELGRKFSANEKYFLKINYLAKPDELGVKGSEAITSDKGLFFINPKGTDKNKMPQIWTQGETQANSVWFPTIDSPNEKMTSEIYMTVDDKFTTLSNGSLEESKKNNDGTRTDHWVMDLPHSPYLLMMTVGEFKKITGEPWNGKEISYYVEKEYAPYAKDIFGDTKEMIEFFSSKLGVPYPWQKYSQVVVRDYVSGAMENTSATLHGDFMVYQTTRDMLDGKKGEDVISHELFHQWFGDLVTAESWSNLPLNESFATYGEYLWQEYKHGRDAADAHSYHSRNEYMNSSLGKEVDLVRFHYDDKEEMFDAFSYNKGGQVLHMLRKYVGDEAFFASLKLYLDKNKFRNAEIHDLRLAFEEISGEDMNWFFNQWFLAKGYPLLEISKEYDATLHQLKIKVKQVQDTKEFPVYVLPLFVDVYVKDKVTREKIVITQKEQEFILNAGEQPQLVNFDAERQLLCRKKYERSPAEFKYQYNHAPLFADRLEAVTALASHVKEPGVYDVILKAATSDNWHEIREEAIRTLRTFATEKEAELKPLLEKIARHDKINSTRCTAIEFLSKNYQDAKLEFLYTDLLKDSSYSVMATALQAIASVNGAKAVKAASAIENEKNDKVMDAVAFVYAMGGTDENLGFFHGNMDRFTGLDFFQFIYHYRTLIARCKKLSSYETFFEDMKMLAKENNKYVMGYAIKMITEDLNEILSKMPDKNEGGENFRPLKEKVLAYGKNN